MPGADAETPRYRLGPRSTRGLIAGWRTGQIICVAVGLIVGVGTLRSVGGAFGGFLALAATGGGVAVATWPLGGRTVEQWAPTVASFGIRATAEGRHRPWQSQKRSPRGPITRLSMFALPEPGAGHATAGRNSTGRAAGGAHGPGREAGGAHAAGRTGTGGAGRTGTGAPVTGRAAANRAGGATPVAPGGIGVIGDAEASTWSAVLPVGGIGFALLGEAERCDRIAAWSGALAAMARDGAGLQRLQWLSTTYPAWLDGALPAGGSGAAGEHYAQLLREAVPDLWAHEVYVVVTVRHPGIARSGTETAVSRLREQLAALDERLRGAGLTPGPPLSPLGLASCVRRSFDVAPLDGIMVWPWPVGVDNAWSRLRTDATWHATYWIAEWPRCEVGGGFLLPVLLVPGLRRVVSVTMAPLPPLTAVRRAERERTEGTADADLRYRHGFAVTARHRREQEGRQQREVELADGHAGYRYSGYVTVTELDEEALEHACGRLEQAAALAQLELHRLYGAQEEGYCCTLPAGRGCR